MKTILLHLSLLVLTLHVCLAQQTKIPFEVHQMLYYENTNCHDKNSMNKYTIVYQNFNDESKNIICYLESFNGDFTSLYVVNQHKVIHAENFVLRDFNVANTVELYPKSMQDLDDVNQFESSDIKLKLVKTEDEIRDGRMLKAYYFDAKKYDGVKQVVYYIDHGYSGKPFSFHESFYEEMRKEGLPLLGNVVQFDVVKRNGETCTYMLKRTDQSNKKFFMVFGA